MGALRALCSVVGSGFLVFVTAISAAAQSTSTPPRAAWFGGLGGAYSSVDLDQSLLGVSDPTSVYMNGALVAEGAAGGPAVPYSLTDGKLSPQGQIGYFAHFGGGSLMWGIKLSYQYDGRTCSGAGSFRRPGLSHLLAAAPTASPEMF